MSKTRFPRLIHVTRVTERDGAHNGALMTRPIVLELSATALLKSWGWVKP